MSAAGDNGNRMDIILRPHFIKPLMGDHIRIEFTTLSGRGASRVEQLTGRTGNAVTTRTGSHSIKDIQTISRERNP